MTKKILFIVPYPVKTAPSQRFRVELYESVLQESGIKYKIAPFWGKDTWKVLFRPGYRLQKVMGILWGFTRRWAHLFQALSYDYIFIHREATPVGPPVFEWMLTKLIRKRVIYDFDDAIWIPNVSKANRAAARLKCPWKFSSICRWAYKLTPGNEYLRTHAIRFNHQAVLLPTCVDIVYKHNQIKQHTESKPVVGWTGSHSTLFYLDKITPIIAALQAKHDFTFLVIADKKPDLDLKDWTFVPWNEATEIKDLLSMDIGIMPLEPDAWSEGKCGFKLIQYLACGIPAVADPIGVNKEIIEHNRNGFLCYSAADWESSLTALLLDHELRARFGKRGREHIVTRYSIQSQKQKFLSLFE